MTTIPRFGPSKSNVAIAECSFWTTGQPTVTVWLALDDDRAPSAVDDLLHDDIPALIGRPLGLPNVLVAEVTEHVLHHVLELEPREIVQYSYPDIIGL